MDVDISISGNIFENNLLWKRDKLSFLIVHMLYLLNNFPSSIFCDSVFSELLGINWCTLRLTNFMPKAPQWYTRLVKEGGNKTSILPQIKEAFQKFFKCCKKYDKIFHKINIY